MWAALAAAPALVPSWDGLCASRHQDFLTEYWQKRPLLIRGLLSPEEVEALCPLTPDELVDLAGDADVCSRLVLEGGGAWPRREIPADCMLISGPLLLLKTLKFPGNFPQEKECLHSTK